MENETTERYKIFQNYSFEQIYNEDFNTKYEDQNNLTDLKYGLYRMMIKNLYEVVNIHTPCDFFNISNLWHNAK